MAVARAAANLRAHHAVARVLTFAHRLAHGPVVQTRALLVGAVVLCAVRRNAEAPCRLDRVDVRTQKEELPPVSVFLTLDHGLDASAVILSAGVLHTVRRDDEDHAFRAVFPIRVPLCADERVDRPSYRIQQRRGAPHEVLPLRDRRGGADVRSVVEQLVPVVEQHRGDPSLARGHPLFCEHGVVAPDGVAFQSSHGAAPVEDKGQFRKLRFHRSLPRLFRMNEG